MPAFLKEIEAYKKGDYEKALKDAFIGFDATLVNDKVIEELKKLIPDSKGDETDTDDEADEDEENIKELCNESRMPLNELLEKLKDPLAKVKQGESSGTSKPMSPFLRGRRNGSSSKAAADTAAAAATTENGECSSASDRTAPSQKLDVSIIFHSTEMFERNVPFDRNVRKLTKTFWFYRQSSEEEAVSSSSASVENKAAPANRYDINYTAKILACRHFPTMFRSFFSIVLQLVSQQMVHQAVEMAHQAVKAPLAPKQMKETLVTVQIAHPMQIKPLVSNTTNRLVFNSLIYFF